MISSPQTTSTITSLSAAITLSKSDSHSSENGDIEVRKQLSYSKLKGEMYCAKGLIFPPPTAPIQDCHSDVLYLSSKKLKYKKVKHALEGASVVA